MSGAIVKLHAEVDGASCQGIGYCQRVCDTVFKVNADTGVAQVLVDEVTDEETRGLVEEAEQLCPTRAISLDYRRG